MNCCGEAELYQSMRIPFPSRTIHEAENTALHAAGWRYACEASAVGPMLPLAVEVAGERMLICRDDETVVAVDELCPHKAESMRFGVVFEGSLMCPHHQYRFNLKSGAANTRRCAPLRIFATQVVDGQVWVQPQLGA
jgi:nitrite reductase/ring-hydroxylating ferredoxin subunit